MFYLKDYIAPSQDGLTPGLRLYYSVSDNRTKLLGYKISEEYGEDVVQVSDDFERARLAVITSVPRTYSLADSPFPREHYFVLMRNIEDRVFQYGRLASAVCHDTIAEEVGARYLHGEELTAFKMWRDRCHHKIDIEYIDQRINKGTAPLFRLLDEAIFILDPQKVMASENGGQLTDISDTQTGEHWLRAREFPDFLNNRTPVG